jgi:hypothetical protein
MQDVGTVYARYYSFSWATRRMAAGVGQCPKTRHRGGKSRNRRQIVRLKAHALYTSVHRRQSGASRNKD